MLALALKLLGSPKVLGLLGLGALVLALGVQSARLGHAKSDLTKWKGAAHAWQLASATWEASYRADVKNRTEEQRKARNAASEAQSACAARVEQARRSAAIITKIVTKEPKVDPQGCPLRELVDSDSLRSLTTRAR